MRNFNKILFKPIPRQVARILRIVLGVLFIISLPFLLSLVILAYEFTVRHWPLPEYQKYGTLDLTSICEKIRDKNWQELCFLKLKDENFQIDLASLKMGCDFSGCGSWWHGNIKKQLSLSDIVQDPSLCNEIPQNLPSRYYCLALTENPYQCNRIIFVDLFFDSWMKNYCYLDAALAWRNPLLCKRVKNVRDRDFCYLRIITAQIEKLPR